MVAARPVAIRYGTRPASVITSCARWAAKRASATPPFARVEVDDHPVRLLEVSTRLSQTCGVIEPWLAM